MARRELALNVPVRYPQCLPWWRVLTRVANAACSLCYCRCWWVSGAECALWTESHVLQYERKLPVHPDALSARLPTGSCVRVCLAFSSQTCFWKSFFLSLLDQQPLSAVMFHSQDVNSPPGDREWRCVSSSVNWQKNELILPQPLQLKPSLWAAGFLGASLASM